MSPAETIFEGDTLHVDLLITHVKEKICRSWESYSVVP